MNLRYLALRTLLAGFLITVSVWNFAQPPGTLPVASGGSTGSDPPCWDPPCVPVDGGIGFLIAAGALIGVRKLYGKYK